MHSFRSYSAFDVCCLFRKHRACDSMSWTRRNSCIPHRNQPEGASSESYIDAYGESHDHVRERIDCQGKLSPLRSWQLCFYRVYTPQCLTYDFASRNLLPSFSLSLNGLACILDPVPDSSPKRARQLINHVLDIFRYSGCNRVLKRYICSRFFIHFFSPFSSKNDFFFA